MGVLSLSSLMACPHIPWQIIIVILSIIIILCSSLFWYYLYLSVDPCCSILGIILYIISGLCLVIFGLIGIVVAIRKSERGLLFFGGAMGIMFCFQMIQIIIATVALANCGRDDTSSPLDALCETNVFLYYIHVFIVLIVCLLLCIFSFILRKILISAHKEDDNYY